MSSSSSSTLSSLSFQRRRLRSLSSLLLFVVVVVVLLLFVNNSATVGVDAMKVEKVAVIGATGRLGRLTVQQLVERGIKCNILTRQKVELKETTTTSPLLTSSSSSLVPPGKDASSTEVLKYLTSLPGVTAISGDVGNVAALKELVQDCQACIAVFGATRKSKISDLWNHRTVEDTDPTHSKQVNYQGVLNILEACRSSSSNSSSNGCKRIVRITGKGEDPNGIFSILINLLGSMAKAWNYQGEQALRGQTDIDYTIIRPGIMSEEGPDDTNNNKDSSSSSTSLLALADNGQDLPVAKIKYADIASLCIDCLEYDNAARTTLTAMTTTDTSIGKSKWTDFLPTVQPDTKIFPSDMLEQHYKAVQNAIIKIGISSCSVVLLAILIKVFVF